MKMNPFILKFACFIFVYSVPLIPVAVICAPNINSVSGTIVNEGSLTISGSDFGKKTKPAPLRYDSFDQTDLNKQRGQPLINGGWPSYSMASGTIPPVYETDGSRIGNGKHARCIYDSRNGTHPIIYTEHVFSMFYYDGATELSPVYVTFYFKRTHGSVPKTDTFHWFCLTENGLYGDGPRPCIQHSFEAESEGPGSSYSVVCYDGGGSQMMTTTGQIPRIKSEWMRFEGYYVKAQGGAVNGTMEEWVWRGTPTDKFDKTIDYKGNLRTDSNGSTAVWRDLIFGGYCRLGSTTYGPDMGVVYFAEYDDIYIDNTRARVEIGNQPKWEDCTHREIQIPTAWSSNQVTCTINQGSFQDGETMYLFVVDENGIPSPGFMVGPSAQTLAPPSSLTVEQ